MIFGRKPKGYKSFTDAQKELGVSPMTLWRWMKKLGIEPTDKASYLSDEEVKRIKQEREKYSTD